MSIKLLLVFLETNENVGKDLEMYILEAWLVGDTQHKAIFRRLLLPFYSFLTSLELAQLLLGYHHNEHILFHDHMIHFISVVQTSVRVCVCVCMCVRVCVSVLVLNDWTKEIGL